MNRDFQQALSGKSVAARRRGNRAEQSRRQYSFDLTAALTSYAQSVAAYENWQKAEFGGIVERLVLRTPLRKADGEPEQISGSKAEWECSGVAIVVDTAGTFFERFEGSSIQYLLTLDDVFYYPSKRGAIAELLDTGCSIRTRKATYKLIASEIKGNDFFAPDEPAL